MIEPRPHLRALLRTGPGAPGRSRLLRLDMNENPDGLPEAFVRAALADIDGGALATYPEYAGLVDKIAASCGLDARQVFLANGSDAAIKALFEAYVAPGDTVLLTDPTFAMYPVYCRMFQAKAEVVAYREDLAFPFETFLERLAAKPRLAVLINPNNPTGQALALPQLEAFAAAAAAHDVLAVVDEAYFHYLGVTAMPLVARHEGLVVLRTFSKLCGLAAARLGFAAADANIVTALNTVNPTFAANGLAVHLAERLLDAPEVLEEQMAAFRRGKAYLLRALDAAGIPRREGAGNFVLLPFPDRAREIAAGLRERGVLVASGFGHPGLRDCIRVTVGGEASMERFVAALSAVLEERARHGRE
ncbi:histidinol-phosphate transaminase [Solidesulfovibrio sp.]|uniref:pyridoxal phosphate-dependent aminotransferase n=1 Tax=Solidesulfovibrio sp. TaxID=2910990 RepID=UPI002B21CF00|nr:histidinol-phosphate transaminase [Solidesulfovibrio sp.]MEA5089415.1 histidinol-phosphate transaminase [Solidesulfovibrio sp.]